MSSLPGPHARQMGRIISDRLVKDLASDRFVLFSQSIVALDARAQDPGFREILVRFKDEEQDLQSPGMFLPLLEEQGLMPLLDRWIVTRVARWIAEVEAQPGSRPAPRCSVNLSPDTMHRDREFAGFVVELLANRSVAGRSFCFEVPVTEALSDPAAIEAMLRPLREAGCAFVLSGFGGDEAAFALLESPRFELVKIDGALVRDIVRDPRARTRLEGVNVRCHESGAKTIGMQVEDPGTLQVLRDLEVDFAQGFGIETPRALEPARELRLVPS